MATIESWSGNFADIGPIYPMVGTEGLLALIGIASWIVWHIIQARRENKIYEEEVKKYGDAESLSRMINAEDPENP